MSDDAHFRKLERMYHAAPVTRWYGASLRVSEGRAEVRIPVREEFYHGAGAVHGSVYFRALDDAAFFAVNSVVEDSFVLTVSFTVHFLRPVSAGELRAEGRLVHRSARLYVAEASVADGEGRPIGLGTGTFVKSGTPLDERVGYA